MSNSYDLKNKVALITGAGSVSEKDGVRLEGIGSAIARTLAASGADLFFTYNRNADGAENLKKEILSKYPDINIETGKFNAADGVEGVKELLGNFKKKYNRIDILINNLGTTAITDDEIPHHESAEAVEKLFQINLLSVYELTKRVLEFMIEKKCPGHVATISSCSVSMPHSKRPGYGLTKRALSGMTTEFAGYYGQTGITLVDLQLGIFKTPMTAGRLPVYEAAAKRGEIPSGRLGEPEEVGEFVAFFCSGACDYLHGASIPMDGGLSIKSFDKLTIE